MRYKWYNTYHHFCPHFCFGASGIRFWATASQFSDPGGLWYYSVNLFFFSFFTIWFLNTILMRFFLIFQKKNGHESNVIFPFFQNKSFFTTKLPNFEIIPIRRKMLIFGFLIFFLARCCYQIYSCLIWFLGGCAQNVAKRPTRRRHKIVREQYKFSGIP